MTVAEELQRSPTGLNAALDVAPSVLHPGSLLEVLRTALSPLGDCQRTNLEHVQSCCVPLVIVSSVSAWCRLSCAFAQLLLAAVLKCSAVRCCSDAATAAPAAGP